MAKIRCKKCGHVMIADIIVSDMPEQSGYNITPRQTFKQTIPGIAPASPAMFEGYDYEKRQPAREPNIHADVIVPALQSAITGVLSGAITTALMLWLAYDSQAAISTGGIAAMVTTCGMWLVRMDTHQRLLWLVESVTGRDVDGDQQVGKPEKEPTRVEVQEGTNTRIIDLPPTDDQLRAIAELTVNGEPFNRRRLEHIIDGDLYTDMVNAMLAGRLLTQKGKGIKAGVELTPAGKAVWRRLLKE